MSLSIYAFLIYLFITGFAYIIFFILLKEKQKQNHQFHNSAVLFRKELRTDSTILLNSLVLLNSSQLNQTWLRESHLLDRHQGLDLHHGYNNGAHIVTQAHSWIHIKYALDSSIISLDYDTSFLTVNVKVKTTDLILSLVSYMICNIGQQDRLEITFTYYKSVINCLFNFTDSQKFITLSNRLLADIAALHGKVEERQSMLIVRLKN